MSLLGAAYRLAAGLEAALEPLGLSLAKLGVLSRLVEAGEPLSLSALAERLACVRSNVTSLVDRLEADKLVARQADSKDRRSIRASVTVEGRARYESGQKALDRAAREAFSHLGPGEREALAKVVLSLKR